VFLWERSADGGFGAKKVITIPAEPAEADELPDALKPFGAVPPLVSDIALSVDDRSLYVSCWGTGELRQYDVADIFNPKFPWPQRPRLLLPARSRCFGLAS
jgi:selenium-binding protein 1